MKKTLIILTIAALGACSSNEMSEAKSSPLQAPAEKSDGITYAKNYDSKEIVKKSALKLIKTADLKLTCTRIGEAKNYLDEQLEKFGGYYGKEKFDETEYKATYYLILRIPSKDFSRFMVKLGNGPTKLVSKNVESKDVSEDFADTESRIQSKRIYLKRYQDFLTKVKSVEELIQMEEQIRMLIEEIEAAESHLRFLEGHIAFSEIKINLTKYYTIEKAEEAEPGFWSKISDSLSSGWKGVQGLLISLASIWPALLIFVGLGFLFRKRISSLIQSIRSN